MSGFLCQMQGSYKIGSRSFLGIGSLFFYKSWHGVRINPYETHILIKNCPKMGRKWDFFKLLKFGR